MNAQEMKDASRRFMTGVFDELGLMYQLGAIPEPE